MATLEKYLRRYTDLPSLVYLLTTRCITLLDPETWDDKNDSHYLRVYKEKKHLGAVLAVCFTQNTETYHHWRVFASGPSGVCITFQHEELVRAVRKHHGIKTGQVTYLKVTDIRKKRPATHRLAFLKRHPYEQENEFRVIFESRQKCNTLDIPIPLSSIDRVTLSPWLHPKLSDHVKKMLWRMRGCHELGIVRSTLISNEEWKLFADSASDARS